MLHPFAISYHLSVSSVCVLNRVISYIFNPSSKIAQSSNYSRNCVYRGISRSPVIYLNKLSL
ncbi:unnamed protein product [Haemonchus placei]|uniref:Uncharacterized protein n=1 Tax=Haemonchus placei TaxID=6290 RepID=A0A3P7Y1U0_HAEPC|nr:unnamed protein product [Haemonchus placei]